MNYKMNKNKIKATIKFLIIISIFSLQSCIQDRFPESLERQFAVNFNYMTTTDYRFVLKVFDTDGNALENIPIRFYKEDPHDFANLTTEKNECDYLINRGVTNAEGEYPANLLALPSYKERIVFFIDYPGFSSKHYLDLSSTDKYIIIGENDHPANPVDVEGKSATFYDLGPINEYGIPEYLEDSVLKYNRTYLNKIHYTLPECNDVFRRIPNVISNTNQINIQSNTSITLSFLYENTKKYHSLSYFTYPTGSKPTTIDDVEKIITVFPKVTYGNGTDGLITGHQVKLKYYNAISEELQEEFPAGTSIGWIVHQDAWKNKVITRNNFVSSINVHNQNEIQQSVILYDESSNTAIVSFEENTIQNTNQRFDFNDIMFTISFGTPQNHLASELSGDFYTPKDSDGDDVFDFLDEYPQNPVIAFTHYYPDKTNAGTLAYEDLWPFTGDYDFNDVVLVYRHTYKVNKNHEVDDINTSLIMKAYGGTFQSAFAWEYSTPWSNVKRVTGLRQSYRFVEKRSSGVEAQQPNAVIVAFDNVQDVLLTGTGPTNLINTFAGSPFIESDTMDINTKFVQPIYFPELGIPPYNPFIIVNKDRNKEIHLPNNPPTVLADIGLFSVGDDDSNVEEGKYYASDRYLPWGLHIPEKFEYPYEKKTIMQTYLLLQDWANSEGVLYKDWFKIKEGYVNEENIYKVPETQE